MSDFSHIKVRKARAEHGCVDCHGVIHKGERYAVYSGACEGNVYAEKVCTACAIVRWAGVTWILTTIAPTEAQKENGQCDE